MRDRAPFVYIAWTVDAVGRICAITCNAPLMARYFQK